MQLAGQPWVVPLSADLPCPAVRVEEEWTLVKPTGVEVPLMQGATKLHSEYSRGQPSLYCGCRNGAASICPDVSRSACRADGKLLPPSSPASTALILPCRMDWSAEGRNHLAVFGLLVCDVAPYSWSRVAIEAP